MNANDCKPLGDLGLSEEPSISTGAHEVSSCSEDALKSLDTNIKSKLPSVEPTFSSLQRKRSLPEDSSEDSEIEDSFSITTTGGARSFSRSPSPLGSPESGQTLLTSDRQIAPCSDNEFPGSPRSIVKSPHDPEVNCPIDRNLDQFLISLLGFPCTAFSRRIRKRPLAQRELKWAVTTTRTSSISNIIGKRNRDQIDGPDLVLSQSPLTLNPRLACPYQAFDPLAPPLCGSQNGRNHSGGFENFYRIKYFHLRDSRNACTSWLMNKTGNISSTFIA